MPILETEAVTKRFGTFTAVDRVTVGIEEGETLGIIGPNGAGKTTFFNLLSGYFVPDEGRVILGGKDITGLPPHERIRMGMARTFQLVSVFDNLSVFDNVLLSAVRFSQFFERKRLFYFGGKRVGVSLQEKVTDVLKEVGIAPQFYRQNAQFLSYGNRRKLEMAMALVQEPRILLLDEPFSGLGDAEIPELFSLIKELKKRMTIVLIEHKISFVLDLVERLLVMHEGRIIADGLPRVVIDEEHVRKVYWGS
uniref:ABC transporter ATP-binding protein n=1 Tax=Candidatus Caldatribacterium saccharofermentans TaxID=1454753 RepID=A0A7V4WKI5_9BACT